MLKYLNKMPNEYEDQLNLAIMKKEYDKPLHAYVYDALKGYELLPNIRLMGYEWDDNEEHYNINDHTIRRNKNKNKQVKSMAETRCGLMHVHVEVDGLDGRTGKMKTVRLVLPIVIPIQDKNGYYLIKGKKCSLIYQLVDKVLYPHFGAVKIKSLMPLVVETHKNDFTDTNGDTHTIHTYTILIFKDSINVLLIYSHIATDVMLNFLEVSPFIKVMKLGDPWKDDGNTISFTCGEESDIIIRVNKEVFNKEPYVQSITGCLIQLYRDNNIQYADINNWENWMIIVGKKDSVIRGQYQHIFFNRLLDEVTKKEIKIDYYDKQNIYYLLRYILQNFYRLWTKDNLSLVNKRLRCNEYVSSFMTAEVSHRMIDAIKQGTRAGLSEYMNLFKFPRDILITKLHSSGCLEYADNVSDSTFPTVWKTTKKGESRGGWQMPSTCGPSSTNCWNTLRALSTAA